MISWNPKEDRIISNSVIALFSTKAFIRHPNPEYFEDIRNLSGIVTINHKQHFLAPHVRSIYSRLTAILFSKNEIANHFTRNEVYQQVEKSHKSLLANVETVLAETYINSIITGLDETRKVYKFITAVDGIELIDEHKISFGSISLCRSNKSILSEIQFAKGEDEDTIAEQINSKYWIIGEVYGGPEFARNNFERSAQIAVGIIAIYWSALFEFGFLNTKIYPKLTPYANRTSAILVRWVKNGGCLTITRDWGTHQSIKINKELLSEMSSNLFLEQLSSLTSISKNSELQCALRTAVLWFNDAYSDDNITMKFIKLWTCSECFFSKSRENITSDNATGIAVILAYAGFQIISPDEYRSTKSKIKKLYNLRSKAVHNAELELISHDDINTLAYWISWTIISITALVEQGYTTICQLKEQIARLDSIESEVSNSAR